MKETQNENPPRPNQPQGFRMIDDIHSAHYINSRIATVSYSLASIRGSTLLNGGGAVAVLSFMAAGIATRHTDMVQTLSLFVAGAILSCFTASVRYVGQVFYTMQAKREWENNQTPKDDLPGRDGLSGEANYYKVCGIICQILASLMIVTSFILFICGSYSSHDALLEMCNPGKAL